MRPIIEGIDAILADEQLWASGKRILEKVKSQIAVEQLQSENKRLKEIFTKHNLLPFLAEGKCICDPDVGACPCESCAAREILEALKETMK